MFDPFNDFEQQGYLRNNFQLKDPADVQEMEHALFRAGLDDALNYLSTRVELQYQDFLTVHHILFSAFYPWAGQDRSVTARDSAISKAGTMFCHPLHAQLAVEHGLRMGHNKELMLKKPGEIMGLFAYGHPFLDGNGRTMLLIHSELCHRAGFCIEWSRTNKTAYLNALSAEITTPSQGILDQYLLPFIGASLDRNQWGGSIKIMPGLDGSHVQDAVDGAYSDARVAHKYQEYEMTRNRYAQYQTHR